MGIQLNLRKYLGIKTRFAPVDQGNTFCDDTFTVHPINPPPARRWRQACFLGDLSIGRGAILLKISQNFSVKIV
jgi:hypothetical protein